MTEKACGKTNTLPKMKICAEYTLIYIHYLIWGMVLEIRNEMGKEIQRREILRGDLQH